MAKKYKHAVLVKYPKASKMTDVLSVAQLPQKFSSKEGDRYNRGVAIAATDGSGVAMFIAKNPEGDVLQGLIPGFKAVPDSYVHGAPIAQLVTQRRGRYAYCFYGGGNGTAPMGAGTQDPSLLWSVTMRPDHISYFANSVITTGLYSDALGDMTDSTYVESNVYRSEPTKIPQHYDVRAQFPVMDLPSDPTSAFVSIRTRKLVPICGQLPWLSFYVAYGLYPSGGTTRYSYSTFTSLTTSFVTYERQLGFVSGESVPTKAQVGNGPIVVYMAAATTDVMAENHHHDHKVNMSDVWITLNGTY